MPPCSQDADSPAEAPSAASAASSSWVQWGSGDTALGASSASPCGTRLKAVAEDQGSPGGQPRAHCPPYWWQHTRLRWMRPRFAPRGWRFGAGPQPSVSLHLCGLWAGSRDRGEQNLAVVPCHTSCFRCLWPSLQPKVRLWLLRCWFCFSISMPQP